MTRLGWLWRHLPCTLLFYNAYAIPPTLVHQFDFAPGAALGLGLFPWGAGLACAWAVSARRGWRAWLGRAAALLAPGLLVTLPVPRIDPVWFLRLFEVGALGVFLLLAVHAWRFGPAPRGREIFLWGWLYGAALENGGIWMGFFTEPGYWGYLPGLPAPVATISGWCSVVYLAVWGGERIGRRLAWPGPGSRALVGTGLALALDLAVDRLATRAGAWVWHESLVPAFFGVPLVNFTAWGAALFPVLWAFHRFAPPDRERRLLLGLPVCLAVSLALVLAGTLLLEGPGSAAWRLFIQAGGALLGR